MDFSKLVQKRYSVRAYKPEAVSDDTLGQVLDAARFAPTAANRQPIQFVVVHTAGRQEDLKRIYNKDWFVQAPVVVCACKVTAQGWVRRQDSKNYSEVDIAIAMDHLILAATDLGLGTCWIGAFEPEVTHQVLGIPADVEPIAFTPLGYPSDEPKPKKRKERAEVVHFERW